MKMKKDRIACFSQIPVVSGEKIVYNISIISPERRVAA